MKKLLLTVLLGIVMNSHAQQAGTWSFTKGSFNDVTIASNEGKMNITYLKNQERNQLLISTKNKIDCVVCSMDFFFSDKRNINADVEYLGQSKTGEYTYAILNKTNILKTFYYASSFVVRENKTGGVYNFTSSNSTRYFSSNYSEWQYKNGFYMTDSLNYYNGKDGIVSANFSVNKSISSIQNLSFKGTQLDCNQSCFIDVYFAQGTGQYQITKDDVSGKLFKFSNNFIKDMVKYNNTKDSFAIKVKTVERGYLIFKFDSSTFDKNYYL